MPYAIQSEGQNVRLEIDGSVTARDVAALARSLASSISSGAAVTVHAARLEDADTSVLQLLVSLRKTVPVFQVEDPSDALLDVADRCGLRREILSAGKEAL